MSFRKVFDFIFRGDFNRFLKFALVGVSGIGVNVCFLWLGKRYFFTELEAPWDFRAGLALAIGISIFTNFLLNDWWTWRDREKRGTRHWFLRVAKYYLVAAVAAGVNYAVALLFHEGLGVHYQISNLLGIACAMVINFFIQNYWTFKE